jgi:hypothetical protein
MPVTKPAAAYHPVRRLISPDGEPAHIDLDLVPLIRALWDRGFETASCCQDVGESIRPMLRERPHLGAWVDRHLGFATIDLPIPDGMAALAAVVDSGPRDAFYERMTYWASEDAWSVSVPVLDLSCASARGPVRSEFAAFGIQLIFPRGDIAEFTRRLQ